MSKTNSLFRPTEYFKPTSVEEAVKLLAQYYGNKGSFIAGGTDILVVKDSQIEALIDITDLGLNYIKSDSRGIRIGAATTLADIEVSSVINKSPYHIIAKAAHELGTPQIRNMGTIGGNICSAVPSADSAPALLALDATLSIEGPTRERSMDITDFFQGVRKNALDRNELLIEIQLPIFPIHTGATFIKKGRVATSDLALVNIGVCLIMTSNNVCQDVRIALGAVAPTPLRAKKAEAMLQGEKPQEELLERVADCASKEIKPINDIRSSAEYRTTMSRVLVEQALREAVARAIA